MTTKTNWIVDGDYVTTDFGATICHVPSGCKQNLRLLSAAPDLLVALEAIARNPKVRRFLTANGMENELGEALFAIVKTKLEPLE